MITQLDDIADLTTCIEHHVPRQACDLAGTQAGFRRQQDDHTVADRMPGAVDEGQEICQIERCKGLGLFAELLGRVDKVVDRRTAN